jgi:hypothetical protein
MEGKAKEKGCLGCRNCESIVVGGDHWGYTCTNPEKGIVPNPLRNEMIYGYHLLITMGGPPEVCMNDQPPSCKMGR